MNDDDRLTLDRFLRTVPELDEHQLLQISAAHERSSREAREEARERAADIARQDGLLDELQALHGTIAQWVGSRMAISKRYTMEGILDSPMLSSAREQARPALLDAATGLFLEDRLTGEDRDVLLGAADSVIG